ncbi:MAG TPA: hypothetical protein VGH87_28140 [Polyangiaceae bacterium]
MRGWIGAGGRNAIGPAYSDFGVYAMGGLWLSNEHLQPFARVGWSQGGGDGTSIDAFRFGAGLGAGAPLAHDRVWLGGTAAIEGASVWSQAGGDARLVGMISVSALFQLRVFERFLIGVEAGPDFFPSLLRSRAGVLEWDAVRFNAGLRLGVVLGAPVK